MTYKTILVHVGADSAAQARLDAAMALGQRFGSTIIGVGAAVWETYVDPDMGVGAGETLMLLREQAQADVAAAEAAFKKATAGYGGPIAWKGVTDYPAATMNRFASGADLVIASRKPKHADVSHFAAPGDLLMGAGLPVLVTPTTSQPLRAEKVVIGWKNTRESRRAVGDALPLLVGAQRVYVVQVSEHDAAGGLPDPAELDDVVERLNRHGIFAEASMTPRLGGSVAEDILQVAASRDCGLAVVGAYGHTRLREWVFGGVTADLLAQSPIPILFSR